MKHLLILPLFLFSMMACRKGTHSLNANGDTLIGISVDTAGIYGFTYTGGQITGITNGLPGLGSTTIGTIQYITVDSGDRLLVTFPGDTLTYFLTLSKLPIWIYQATTSNPRVYDFLLAQFYYSPGTDVLDSAVFQDINTYTYKFTYTGQNITRMDESYNNGMGEVPLGTFQFTYGDARNIFRGSDSLFYVYAYPATVAGEQDVIIAAFFAETFSANTFTGMTAINSYEFGSFSSNMTYTVNQDGKITSENFTPAQNGELAAKNFYYK
jgi:hypothetical protein